MIKWCVLLLILFVRGHALPTCADPTNGADTTCPPSSQCWDNAKTATTVTWSLHDQCLECTVAQQKSVIVQNTETVIFKTDGTFQRDNVLVIYKVNSLIELQNCDISGATQIGNLAPDPVPGTGPPPAPISVDVTNQISPGVNYFISIDAGDPSSTIPSSCEQGARLIIYEGSFDCGDVNSPCSNVGPCVFDHDSSNFKCQCPDGFRGSVCEEIDECFPNTACGDPEFQGVCVDGNCDFSCACIGGFSSSGGDSKTCDVRPTDCSANPCLNGGTCSDTTLPITCECIFGTDPANNGFCVDLVDCTPDSCKNGGTCVDAILGFSCICPDGFIGSDCSISINECSATTCVKGGVCTDGDLDVTCGGCDSGWTGKFCQVNVNDCLTSTCVNGATCVDGSFDHTCNCAAGFTGVHCETDIDECNSFPCLNSAACSDRVNSFECDCPADFTGVMCETDIDECASKPCQNGGTCRDLVNGYQCACPDGITGTMCETDIDECLSFPCENEGTCQNLVNVFDCECLFGFTGETCQTNSDDCMSNPCENGATCVDDIARYDCVCPSGFTGTHCETNIDECHSNPCENGGTCQDDVNKYTCECLLGFTGTHCETNIPECESFPCQNGGECIDDVNRFDCNCVKGFTGVLCEININECLSKPCLNGGTCHNGNEQYTCACPPVFSGTNCEVIIDACSIFDPCQHQGTCLNIPTTIGNIAAIDFESPPGTNAYGCACTYLYTGRVCQTLLVFPPPPSLIPPPQTDGFNCSRTTEQCLNGGTCHQISDNIDAFCLCSWGFTGETCDQGWLSVHEHIFSVLILIVFMFYVFYRACYNCTCIWTPI